MITPVMHRLLTLAALACAVAIPAAETGSHGLPARDARTLRLQVLLDRAGFAPGKIDGRPGDVLARALGRYRRAHGVEPVAATGSPMLTTYVLTEADLRRIGPCPNTPAEQAETRWLPYRTLTEFLAERFHCGESLLVELNPWLAGDPTEGVAGRAVSVPDVTPFRIEDWQDSGAIPAAPAVRHRTVRVHRDERMLDVEDGDRLIASFPMTPGGESMPTPAGTWTITGMRRAPTFRWDQSLLDTGRRSESFHLLPPGPNSPVGILWCALNRSGIGIHGTATPETISRAASHGCIRLSNWDAARFAGLVTTGVTVIVD